VRAPFHKILFISKTRDVVSAVSAAVPATYAPTDEHQQQQQGVRHGSRLYTGIDDEVSTCTQ